MNKIIIEKYKKIEDYVHYLLVNRNEDFDRYVDKYQKLNHNNQNEFIFKCIIYSFSKGLDYKIFLNKPYSRISIIEIIDILDKKLLLHKQNEEINLIIMES